MERFLDYFVSEHYDLDLNINKHDETLIGTVVVTGAVKAFPLKFHAAKMEIDKVYLLGPSSSSEKSLAFNHADDVLTIQDFATNQNPFDSSRLPCRTSAQIAKLKIVFHKKISHDMQGAYLSTYRYNGRTEKIVTTQFESHYAREAFPCVDEPSAKATFAVQISVPDLDDTVLSNMPVKTEMTYEEKNTTKKVVTFATTPRMSTYLLAFIVGRFHSKTIYNQHGTKITTYAPLNQTLDSVDFANQTAAQALEFYDDKFGVPYPLTKLEQVALPDFEAGAMENWGLVTYRESMLLADQTASLDTKKSIALTVTHELSHQWFGDLVTMAWWDDLWLNESFASVMEYYATDFIYPEFKIWEDFFTGDCLQALRRDVYKDVQAVYQTVHHPGEIATLFDPAIVYAKGARLMLMLIRTMGWDNFRKGIKDYFTGHQYQNTVGDNLWEALSPYANFKPKDFMHAWISEPGFPVITAGQQKRFLLDGPLEKQSWPIPKIQEDMSGHYILNLSASEFSARLKDFHKLTLEEKLRLLIDRSLIVKTELAPSASLLDLLPHFKSEESAAVWEIIATTISDLKIFIEPESRAEQQFKLFVRDLIAEQLSRIGLVTKLGDDENRLRLRATLLSLNYYSEHLENLKQLAELFDDDIASLDPEIRADILDAKIYLDPTILPTFLQKYQTLSDPELKFDLLFAMGLTRDIKNLELLLGLLKKPEIVKPQDHLYLFLFLIRNYKSRSQAFHWLTENWDYVDAFAGDKSIDSYPRYIANTVRKESEKTAYFDFFGPKINQPALTRTIKIAKTEIDARLKLIATDQPAVHQKLSELYPKIVEGV